MNKTSGCEACVLNLFFLFNRTMESEMSNTNGLLDNAAEDAEDQEQDMEELPDDMVELSAPGAGEDSESNAAAATAKDEEAKKKAPVWKKPDKKKKKGGGGGGGAPNKQKQKAKKKAAEAAAGDQDKAQVRQTRWLELSFCRNLCMDRSVITDQLISDHYTCSNDGHGFPRNLKSSSILIP